VDHIVPLAIGGEKLDPRNLQTLCRTCHRQKTEEDRRKGHVYKEI
jgi:5-methylcytosine-specific restriction endonuclease McrA